MIPVPTVDSKICHESSVVIAIAERMSRGLPVTLDTVGEGPCLKSTGLYDLLDNLCKSLNYNPQHITIRTANWLEQHDRYRIVCQHTNGHELRGVQRHADSAPDATKKFDDRFRHFGHFIGHSNRYRLQMASYLYAHQRPRTLQSYHCRVTEEYHREYMGIEDLLFHGADHNQFKDACDLISHSPLEIDTVNAYPILQPANLNITKVYPQIFVEIVSLTFFSGRTFYVDEKLWRPMLMMTPFMIQGPQHVIENIRKLGFETFEDFWDEGYSEDPDNCHVPAMIKNIEQLAQLSVAELESMYQHMLPRLQRNRDRMLALQDQHFEVFQ